MVDGGLLVPHDAPCERPILLKESCLDAPVNAWLLALLGVGERSEEHTSELQSRENLVCRLLLEKKNKRMRRTSTTSAPKPSRSWARCRTTKYPRCTFMATRSSATATSCW